MEYKIANSTLSGKILVQIKYKFAPAERNYEVKYLLSFMLEEDEKIRSGAGEISFDDIRREIFLYESLLKRDKGALIFNKVKNASGDTELMLDITHTQMKPDSDEYRALCREILKRRVLCWETGLKHVQGDYGSQVSVIPPSRPPLTEEKDSPSRRCKVNGHDDMVPKALRLGLFAAGPVCVGDFSGAHDVGVGDA